ncbi:MAG: DUF3501 family protein [Planctomycetes bacterium]|nr:DUF3501 family protein [Planctomycetota bacterium]
MRRVARDELVDWQTFAEERAALQPAVLAAKALRRVHVGEHLTFLFENALTIRWQIQEMLRAERIVREKDVQHELDTYNELLGGPGDLGCTLLVEIVDEAERAAKLARWKRLPECLHVRLADGRRVFARVDERQRDERKLSSVQYLVFPVASETPVAVGCDLDEARGEHVFTPQQRAALAEDLAS